MMDYSSVGKNIRKYRIEKKMTQDALSEKAGVTRTYMGMLERGEKIPSFETFIKILNVLGVSADMILCDVLVNGYKVKDSLLSEKLENISREDRARINDVVNVMLKHSKQNLY